MNGHLETRENVQVVHRMLGSLSKREKRVILARFGLDRQSRHPGLTAHGAQVDLCGEPVRQLIALAVWKLKNERPPEDVFFNDWSKRSCFVEIEREVSACRN